MARTVTWLVAGTILASTAALGFAAAGRPGAAFGAGAGGRPGPRLFAMAGRLADTNGDGEVSRDEWAAAWEKFQARRDDIRGRVLERFDADGDGAMNDAERQTARVAFQARFGAGAGHGEFAERIGRRVFDMDRDGELNEAELAAAQQAREAIKTAAYTMFGEAFDADGDGAFSPDERAAIAGHVRDQAMARREAAVARFDTDADGRLNADESYEVYLTVRARVEEARANRRQGQGPADAGEVQGFIDAVRRGQPKADVNGDGKVDSMDLGRFLDGANDI